jgi:hypothetical protein
MSSSTRILDNQQTACEVSDFKEVEHNGMTYFLVWPMALWKPAFGEKKYRLVVLDAFEVPVTVIAGRFAGNVGANDGEYILVLRTMGEKVPFIP